MGELKDVQTWKLNTDNFITEIIERDLQQGKNAGAVVTRFPPEPNGYLHIGHAKSLTLNFGLAARYGGRCNLRFDDTNPAKEEMEYVNGIINDVKWFVGHDAFNVLWASDYFQVMYDRAVDLIKAGKAYVDDCSAEEIAKMRGAPTEPGTPSPWRDRTVEENLRLFQDMTDGKFADGACVLRAKIDMNSPNTNLRDPVLYRIKRFTHHNTGDKWIVYPMYDWAHGWEDSIEGITHSLCTLEFENHRPLYDWFLDQFPDLHHPRQYEFNKLNIGHTVLSKRKLIELVKEGRVDAWDDPRMPTLCGLRRRGYTPSAIRKFCEATNYTKTDGRVDLAMMEFYIREEMNKTAPRVMAVFDPIKVTLTNYPAGKSELVQVENNPEDPASGSRDVPFGAHLLIDGEDFAEVPAKGWFRMAPGAEVRLKGAYFVTVREVVKDASGKVVELKCTYDPESRGGESPDGRKVKGTIQWVSADHGVEFETRLYDYLLSVESIGDVPEEEDWRTYLNPNSLVVTRAWGEPALKDAKLGVAYQFMRKGYFCLDSKDSKPGAPVFNRTVTLKDGWTKQSK
jgi:glutaminyl-tRNA synthetase